MAQVIDYAAGTRTKPVYDLAGRLVAVKQYDGTAQTDTDILTEFTYTYADKTNYLTEKNMDLPTHDLTATYTYGDAAVGEMPDQVYNVYYDSWSSVDYAYDPLGRLTDETFHVAAGYTIDNAYTYLDVNADRTTTLVSTYSTKTGTYSYTYDNVGNITQIVFTPADTTQSAKTITYQYDNLNRLIRENNEIAGKTWFYYYSGIGNICDVQESSYTPASSFPQERIEVRSHTYGDSTWRDRLTEFNGNTITYDNIGNPTAIGTANLTWQGRTLTQYADGANTYSYEYDMSGHRISKTVNGVKTTYYYDGDQLVAQQSGNNRITFMFDANGSAFGFYYNNAPYFFIKNIQGDVTAITNFAGTVIGTYTYDAWGNLIPEASDLSDEVAAMNPIRYRGYYYDAETGYYFLNSRYYDAEMGRFISADSADVVTLSALSVYNKNLFAYCNNNPIMFADYYGMAPEWWQWALSGACFVGGVVMIATGVSCVAGGVLLCAGVNSIIGSYSSEASGGTSLAGWTGGFITGALSGLGAGWGGKLLMRASNSINFACIGNLFGGLSTSFSLGFAGSMTGSVVTDMLNGEQFDVENGVISSVLNGLTTIIAAFAAAMNTAISETLLYGDTTPVVVNTVNSVFSVVAEFFVDILNIFANMLSEL